MDRNELVQLIVRAVQDFAMSAKGIQLTEVTESTALFGRKGLLDSLGLVSVVLDIEQEVNGRLNVSVSLADDRAMSQTKSPFRTVASLADYTLTLIQEQKGG